METLLKINGYMYCKHPHFILGEWGWGRSLQTARPCPQIMSRRLVGDVIFSTISKNEEGDNIIRASKELRGWKVGKWKDTIRVAIERNM